MTLLIAMRVRRVSLAGHHLPRRSRAHKVPNTTTPSSTSTAGALTVVG